MLAATSDLLQNLLGVLRQFSGADNVSLFLPEPSKVAGRPELLREGDGDPVPEMVDPQAALAFLEAAGDGTAVGSRGDSPFVLHPSTSPDCMLIRIPGIETLVQSIGRKRLGGNGRRHDDRPVGDAPALNRPWLGFRFPDSDEAGSPGQSLRQAIENQDWSILSLALGSSLAWLAQRFSTLNEDPLTRLPGRPEMQAILRQWMEDRSEETTAGLILLNPDRFESVNQRFGRDAGDEIIVELADRLCGAVRSTDFVFRYGAAVFGVVVREKTREGILTVAEKLRNSAGADTYREGGLVLSFSVGVAADRSAPEADPEEAALTLVRQCDQALSMAKNSGGGRILEWQPDTEFEAAGQHDRLSGIFTANPGKDYRNMALLWDMVEIVVAGHEVEKLKEQVLEKISGTFGASFVGLFKTGGEEDDPGFHAELALRSGKNGSTKWLRGIPAEPHQQQMLLECHEGDEAVILSAGDDPDSAFTVRLQGEKGRIGYLLLEGREDLLQIGPTEKVFLEMLARQLALALDHARLADRERSRQEEERRRLQAELATWRRAANRSDLVYASKAMESLLSDVRRVAGTDATILITGESGTGKEVLARTVHDLSPRRKGPFVVVDCGAITTSLIDSELFGHERGAYTGADRRTLGRLAEADGGTILLDEIGEMPLEVQSKLLRFVQEKQYTPVGNSRQRSVDARLIAATNRNLRSAVASGKFREDLFHRLNVVRLVVPPLRERPADVPRLAEHFLILFARDFNKTILGFTPEAERDLLAHRWPGNVRELQNLVMRAVVLCEGDRIGAGELGLSARRHGNDPAVETKPVKAKAEPEAEPVPSGPDIWEEFAGRVAKRIEKSLDEDGVHPMPIWKWIGEDMVLVSQGTCGGVAAQAAGLLGIAESTFRRRLAKAESRANSGLSPRPVNWGEILSTIQEILKLGNPGGKDLLDRARQIVLEAVLMRIDGDVRLGAALMGITEPTFRRWSAVAS